MLPEGQKMLNIFFHTDVTQTDASTLQGGEWPGVPWYPDMPDTGRYWSCALRFVMVHQNS